MSDYRQPSLSEAAHLIAIALSHEYRRECMRYWRERYGESFVAAVEKKAGKSKQLEIAD